MYHYPTGSVGSHYPNVVYDADKQMSGSNGARLSGRLPMQHAKIRSSTSLSTKSNPIAQRSYSPASPYEIRESNATGVEPGDEVSSIQQRHQLWEQRHGAMRRPVNLCGRGTPSARGGDVRGDEEEMPPQLPKLGETPASRRRKGSGMRGPAHNRSHSDTSHARVVAALEDSRNHGALHGHGGAEPCQLSSQGNRPLSVNRGLGISPTFWANERDALPEEPAQLQKMEKPPGWEAEQAVEIRRDWISFLSRAMGIDTELVQGAELETLLVRKMLEQAESNFFEDSFEEWDSDEEEERDASDYGGSHGTIAGSSVHRSPLLRHYLRHQHSMGQSRGLPLSSTGNTSDDSGASSIHGGDLGAGVRSRRGEKMRRRRRKGGVLVRRVLRRSQTTGDVGTTLRHRTWEIPTALPEPLSERYIAKDYRLKELGDRGEVREEDRTAATAPEAQSRQEGIDGSGRTGSKHKRTYSKESSGSRGSKSSKGSRGSIGIKGANKSRVVGPARSTRENLDQWRANASSSSAAVHQVDLGNGADAGAGVDADTDADADADAGAGTASRPARHLGEGDRERVEDAQGVQGTSRHGHPEQVRVEAAGRRGRTLGRSERMTMRMWRRRRSSGSDPEGSGWHSPWKRDTDSESNGSVCSWLSGRSSRREGAESRIARRRGWSEEAGAPVDPSAGNGLDERAKVIADAIAGVTDDRAGRGMRWLRRPDERPRAKLTVPSPYARNVSSSPVAATFSATTVSSDGEGSFGRKPSIGSVAGLSRKDQFSPTEDDSRHCSSCSPTRTSSVFFRGEFLQGHRATNEGGGDANARRNFTLLGWQGRDKSRSSGGGGAAASSSRHLSVMPITRRAHSSVGSTDGSQPARELDVRQRTRLKNRSMSADIGGAGPRSSGRSLEARVSFSLSPRQEIRSVDSNSKPRSPRRFWIFGSRLDRSSRRATSKNPALGSAPGPTEAESMKCEGSSGGRSPSIPKVADGKDAPGILPRENSTFTEEAKFEVPDDNKAEDGPGESKVSAGPPPTMEGAVVDELQEDQELKAAAAAVVRAAVASGRAAVAREAVEDAPVGYATKGDGDVRGTQSISQSLNVEGSDPGRALAASSQRQFKFSDRGKWSLDSMQLEASRVLPAPSEAKTPPASGERGDPDVGVTDTAEALFPPVDAKTRPMQDHAEDSRKAGEPRRPRALLAPVKRSPSAPIKTTGGESSVSATAMGSVNAVGVKSGASTRPAGSRNDVVSGTPRGTGAAVAAAAAADGGMYGSHWDKLEMHRAVYANDEPQLRRFISLRPLGLKQRDHHGNTPLLLALKLARVEMAWLLIRGGAELDVPSDGSFHLLDEAIVLGDENLLVEVYGRLQRQSWGQWRDKVPDLLGLLESNIPDFYLEMHWSFECGNVLAPIVKAVAPHDQYRIWKRGSWLRMDSTITGYTKRLKTQRGNVSLIFLGNDSSAPGTLIKLDHGKKKIYNVLRRLESPTPSEVRRTCKRYLAGGQSKRPGHQVDAFVIKSSDLDFKPVLVQAGQPKTASVGPWACEVYECTGDMQLQTFRKGAGDNLLNGISMPVYFDAERTLADKVMKASASGAVGSPSPGIFNLGEKHRGSQKAKMLAKISTPHKRYEKKIKASMLMSQEFPLTLEHVTPMLEVLSMQDKVIQKLKEVLTTKGMREAGFPAKVSLPLYLGVFAVVTFDNCKIYDRGVLEPELFLVNPNYTSSKRMRKGVYEGVMPGGVVVPPAKAASSVAGGEGEGPGGPRRGSPAEGAQGFPFKTWQPSDQKEAAPRRTGVHPCDQQGEPVKEKERKRSGSSADRKPGKHDKAAESTAVNDEGPVVPARGRGEDREQAGRGVVQEGAGSLPGKVPARGAQGAWVKSGRLNRSGDVTLGSKTWHGGTGTVREGLSDSDDSLDSDEESSDEEEDDGVVLHR